MVFLKEDIKMHTGYKDKNPMYDVPTDYYSIKKLGELYKKRGYTLKQIRIVKVV